MKTLVMLALALAVAVLHAEGPTAASYVQSGLVAQWDAIENAGIGAHATDATVWKDLAGSRDLTLDTANCSWHASALHADGATGFAVAGEAIAAYKTVEVCYRPADASDPHCIFACGSAERFTWSVTNVVITPSQLVRAAATYGDTASTSPTAVYLDGVANENVANECWGAQPSVFSVGWGLPSDRTFCGDVCAIRLYDRALTAAEIAANAAIDQTRFGVVNGASTDEQGRLVLTAETFSNYAHAEKIGDVPGLRKVGGGEVSVTNHPGALKGTLAVEGGTLTPNWADALGSPTSVVVAAGATLNYAAGSTTLAADVFGEGTIRFAGTSANQITALGSVTYGRTDSTLACYFPFENSVLDEKVGGLAPYEDAIGTARASLVADGVCGSALRLSQANGSGSFIRVPGTASMPKGSEAWTFSFWIRPATSGFDSRVYIARRADLRGTKAEGFPQSNWGKGTMWYFVWLGSKLTLSTHGWTKTYGDDDCRVEFNLSSANFFGSWHHIVGTYDSKVLTLYFDGEMKDRKTLPDAMNVTESNNLEIGCYAFAGGDRSNGDYDEVQYCKGAWSAETVAAEYAAKKPPVTEIAPTEFSGLWQTYAANVSFGSVGAAAPLNAASSLEVANGGYFRFFGSQTVAALFGEGIDGGVDIAVGATLTVKNESDAVFAGRLAGGGDFVKDGAGTLTLSGASCQTGNVEVKAGTLALTGHPGYVRDDSELCGYWAFEDAANVGRNSSQVTGNDVAVDAFGNPSVKLVDGVVGKAIRLVEPNSTAEPTFLLTGSASANLPKGTDDFTISFWMRMPSSTPQQSRYAMRYSSPLEGSVAENFTQTGWGSGWWFTLMPNNSFFFGPLNGWKSPASVTEAAFASNCNYSDAQWHHVVGTREGKVWKLYFDGQPVGSYTHSSVYSIASTARMQIGNYNCHTQTNYSYDGDYDEIQFCKGAWSAETVASEYAAKRPNVRLVSAALPEPVAHWTFDKSETVGDDSVFKDSGHLGLHFKNNASGGKSVVCRPHADGTPGGAAYYQHAGAYLALLPSVTDVCKAQLLGGLTTPNFTLNVRVANLSNVNVNNRQPFVCFGNVATAQGCVRISYEGQYVNGDAGRGGWDASQPRVIRVLAGGDNSNEGFALPDTWSTTSGADPVWTTLTLTFAGRTVKVYRDGTYVATRTASGLSLNLDNISLGKTPWGTSSGYMIDDLRVYDCTLSEEQVKALVRSQALGNATGDVPVLPETTQMQVDADATLALDGVVQPLAALTGSGDVTLTGWATQLAVSDLTGFSGNLAGDGRLALADGARCGTTIGVDTTVAGGALKLSLAQKAMPLVKTTGKFILPSSGSLLLTDASGVGSWAGEMFLLAECAGYEGPQDTTGWTFDPSGTAQMPVKGRFLFRGGKLWLRISGGSVVIVR